MADAAFATTSVLRREWVAQVARRFAGILRGLSFSAKHIDPMWNWLKVIGAHARPIAAEVIKDQAVRDRAPGKQECQPVRADCHDAMLIASVSVSRGALPLPA